jgi:nucleotide-binding universal stress UspA family protein
MRVLIALDATPQCSEIVQEVASRPWPAGSEFLLLHVLDPFPFARAPISLERAKAAATEQLQNAAASLIHAGWKMEADVALGRVRKVLSDRAGNLEGRPGGSWLKWSGSADAAISRQHRTVRPAPGALLS